MARKDKKKFAKIDFSDLNNPSRTLLANIRFAGVDKEIRTLAITSPGVDEGKSTTAVSLAMAMAQSGKRTLLIDCDMRRRSLAHILGLRAEAGIYSVLTGDVTMQNAIMRVPDNPNLYFMDCEPNIPNPPDILSTKRFQALIQTLSSRVDYVLIDTPPLGLFVDSAIVSSLVDGVLIAVRENESKRKTTFEVLEQLKQANANVLGFVVTFARRQRSNYYYYYSYYNEENKRLSKEDVANQLQHAEGALDNRSNDDWAASVGVDARALRSNTQQANATAPTGRHGGRTQQADQEQPRRNSRRTGTDVYAPGSFKR